MASCASCVRVDGSGILADIVMAYIVMAYIVMACIYLCRWRWDLSRGRSTIWELLGAALRSDPNRKKELKLVVKTLSDVVLGSPVLGWSM